MLALQYSPNDLTTLKQRFGTKKAMHIASFCELQGTQGTTFKAMKHRLHFGIPKCHTTISLTSCYEAQKGRNCQDQNVAVAVEDLLLSPCLNIPNCDLDNRKGLPNWLPKWSGICCQEPQIHSNHKTPTKSLIF